MNKLLQLILVVLIMSITAFANEFNDAINAVFGEATNYFTFQGTFDPGSNTITLSNVTRKNDEVYGNGEFPGEAFPLVIPGSKAVTNGDTTTTYTITLRNLGQENGAGRLFDFGNRVILTLSGISAPANCKYLFYCCPGLIEADLSSLDTSNVTNMNFLFHDCNFLTKLDLSNFNTSNVTNMRYMFNKSTRLPELDLSSFDTSKVTDMQGMFQFCSSLKKVDISNFDTGKVKDMGRMFKWCTGLRSLKVSSDFPKNASASIGYIFSELTPDNLNGKIIIRSPNGTFNPRFVEHVEESEFRGTPYTVDYKDIVVFSHLPVNLITEIDAGETLVYDQNADVSLSDKTGILLEDNSVLENATIIKCPTEEGQKAYFVLANGATSATIKNIFAVQHDGDFDKADNVYMLKHGAITGNYGRIAEEGDASTNHHIATGGIDAETTGISIVNSAYLEDLTSLTENDTVVFAIHPISGESLDQNTVVIKNEESEPAEIVANISNNVDKDGYTATDIELQGSLKFSGDQSGFVNGKATASGADIEFVGNKSMFQVPLELTGNSKVKISEFLNHERDITVDKGSQMEIKENVTFSGGTFRFGC